MAAKKKPSKTAIATILRDCGFDPREIGPLSVIADVGDAQYYCHRATEFVRDVTHGEARGRAQIVPKLQQAIGLLALAINKYNE